MKLCIAFGVCAAWSEGAFAQQETEPEAQPPVQQAQPQAPGQGAPAPAQNIEWIRAIVVTDGAAIYSKPDFDSPVQDYLGYQTKVIVSRRPYAGTGGMGLFHRIQYNSNKQGFIPDTDVRVSKSEAAGNDSKPTRKKNPSKAFENEKKSKRERESIYMTRYVGAAVSRVHFTEKFSGHKLSDQMYMYGLRMTGPGTLFDGPPLDFNLWFSAQNPHYYNVITTGSAHGFLLFGDVQAMFPLVDTDNNIVNYGMGMMWTYTHYNVPVKSPALDHTTSFDSQEFRIGADLSLGYGRRIGRSLLRGDVKYYIEKTQYAGLVLSYQMEY